MSHNRAGKPFRPSNGTQGEIFESDFCDRCKRDRGCGIRMAALMHDETESEYPKEWVYNEHGQPTCTAFENTGSVASSG